ncbi:MAG: hypothetical protein ACKOYM_03520 [Actinomycetes bacterium]
MHGDRSNSRSGLAIGFVALFAIFLFAAPTPSGDSHLVFADAYSMVHDGNLELSEFDGQRVLTKHYSVVRTPDGVYDYFPFGAAMLAVPGVLVLDAAHLVGVGSGSYDAIGRSDGSIYRLEVAIAALAAAGTAVILAMAVRALLDPAVPLGRNETALLVTLIGCTTPLWSTSSTRLWQHTAAGLPLAVTLLVVARLLRSSSDESERRLGLLGGVAAALIVVARPSAAPIALVLVGAMLWAHRRAGWAALTAFAVSGIGVLFANVLLLGSWRPPYISSGRLGLHDRYLEAIGANLVSPGRGVLVYCPLIFVGLVLAVRLRPAFTPMLVISVAASVAALLGVSAYGEKWWAGHSWGPRFMIEAVLTLVPVAAAAIITALHTADRRRAVTWCVVPLALWSVFVHGVGATTGANESWSNRPVDVDDAPERIWSWSDPPFGRS